VDREQIKSGCTPLVFPTTDNTILSFIEFCECQGFHALEIILSIPEARCSLRLPAIGRFLSRRGPPCLRRHLREFITISQLWTDNLYVAPKHGEEPNVECCGLPLLPEFFSQSSHGNFPLIQHSFAFNGFNDDF
jgi:hypothetical protein